MKKLLLTFISLGIGCVSFLTFFTSHSQRQDKAQVDTLRVMAYNIHHANPPSKPDYIDIDAIAAVIQKQDPHVVALQEVDVHTNRSGKNLDQAKAIAEKLGMHYFFAKAIDYDDGEYGQAILSKFPIEEEKIHRLPSTEGTNAEPRILATVRIKTDSDRHIRFGTVHLDAQRDPTSRRMQAEELNRIAKDEALPFVIAGDFNASEGHEPLQILAERFEPSCTDCPFTIPEINPRRAIDFIMFDRKNDWKVFSHNVVDEQYASDHLPVVATLLLN